MAGQAGKAVGLVYDKAHHVAGKKQLFDGAGAQLLRRKVGRRSSGRAPFRSPASPPRQSRRLSAISGITSRKSWGWRFLDVIFQGIGDIIVDHQPNILFIHPHAKGGGGRSTAPFAPWWRRKTAPPSSTPPGPGGPRSWPGSSPATDSRPGTSTDGWIPWRPAFSRAATAVFTRVSISEPDSFHPACRAISRGEQQTGGRPGHPQGPGGGLCEPDAPGGDFGGYHGYVRLYPEDGYPKPLLPDSGAVFAAK